MNKWKIVDWAGNNMFNNLTFQSFDDAWSYIFTNIPNIDNAYDEVFAEEIECHWK